MINSMENITENCDRSGWGGQAGLWGLTSASLGRVSVKESIVREVGGAARLQR